MLEAGRQAAPPNSGTTAVVGMRADPREPVPRRGSLIEVAPEPGGPRLLVTAVGRVAATGAVTLLRP
ncbi:hypothetical protein GCM10010266_30740 [Streptomyces griseomycini]|nr:hypothetical protein GCM10010266_30740 [Streptomyces griseomycini]GGR20607.1 hypothetical protein GCM10015536_27720 [Streptomyces griseomycini]